MELLNIIKLSIQNWIKLMGNRAILLWKKNNEVIDNIDDVEICETRKKLNEHPFVDFVDLPAFLSFYCDLNNEVHSRPCMVVDHRTNNIFEVINDPKNSNKRFYIMSPNKSDVYYKLPIVYCPNTFNPIKNYYVRMAIVEMVTPEMGRELGLKNSKTQTIKNNNYKYILIR